MKNSGKNQKSIAKPKENENKKEPYSNNMEMVVFAIIMVFIFFSNRLDPTITLTITGALLAWIFFYRRRKK